jgi:hypothetical protein
MLLQRSQIAMKVLQEETVLAVGTGYSMVTNELALITQMRAGTHFVCKALRIGWQAALYRPVECERYVVMEDEYILKGLHERVALPPANPELRVYFSHYYHPHHHRLGQVLRVYLIGFPFDSFYSDGVVYSDTIRENDPKPSGTRKHAEDYVLRFESAEWKLLEPIMRQNAAWLMEIEEGEHNLVLRYEDFFLEFEKTMMRLARFIGRSSADVPRPVMNARRCYWSQRYSEAYDSGALATWWDIFAPSIEKFYPERNQSLRAAL